MDIFTEMEEKSLPLVEKSQHTSEILDSIRSNIQNIINEQNYEVEQLQIKINHLQESSQHELKYENSCENILKYIFLFYFILKREILCIHWHFVFVFVFLFCFRQHKKNRNDPFIEQVKETIEILYRKYITYDEIDVSVIQMLQTIEKKIKSLFNIIEQMDLSVIIEAEKVLLDKSKILVSF